MKKFIIFTDLDGTLLDHHTYSFKPAEEAISLIRKMEIPLIFASSKTRSEILNYQCILEMEQYPLICENGSAVISPHKLISETEPDMILDGRFVYILGKKYSEIAQTLESIADENNVRIQGFHNSDFSVIRERTGLSEDQVKFAMQREFTVPVFYDQDAEDLLKTLLPGLGLRIIYGGRFMHITGPSDKGDAVRFVKKSFPADSVSIGLGDTLNDTLMLETVDIPVLIKRHDGTFDERIRINNLVKPFGIGPDGWREAIIKILKDGGIYE